MDKKTIVSELFQLLPLDDESLLQMVDNAFKLPTHSAIAEYWLGLLGQSPDALDYITKFTSRLTASNSTDKVKDSSKPKSVVKPSNSRNNVNPWNQVVPEKPKINNKTKLNKNVSRTTSQLLDKPKEAGTTEKKKKKHSKIENLKDIEAVLRQLEIDNKDDKSVCNCMARVHPLFEVAPNCLNCGKIICSKEGLRPCSSCGEELIDPEEKKNIIAFLEAERRQLNESDEIKKAVVVEKPEKKKKITVSLGAGSNLWEQQGSMFAKLEKESAEKASQLKEEAKRAKELKEQNNEIQFYENQSQLDPHLVKARQNLENLLNFQSNSAERTKIIDQASDFDLPTGSNLNMWSSGIEKALQLKKQQKQLRKQEKKEKELLGRGKKVLDITIGKNGKAVMREVKADEVEESEDEYDEEIAQLEQEIKKSKDAKVDQDLKSVWDYNKDANKWAKPIYIGTKTDGDQSIKEEIEDSQHLSSFGKWDRVQQPNSSANLEDILAVI